MATKPPTSFQQFSTPSIFCAIQFCYRSTSSMFQAFGDYHPRSPRNWHLKWSTLPGGPGGFLSKMDGLFVKIPNVDDDKLLGGSSHLVSGLAHPSYKWTNPTYPIYNQGYNPLTKWNEPPSRYPNVPYLSRIFSLKNWSSESRENSISVKKNG